jgi:hypothetical protein
MCHCIDRNALIACLVLLANGTSVLAEDTLFFDLSSGMEQGAADPDQIRPVVVVADSASTTETPLADDAYFSGDDEPLVLEEQPATLQEACPGDTVTNGGLWRRPAPSYPMPSRSFSLFQSPASYGWDYFERCCPRPWRPRGVGIPRRTSSYRMDYRPYTLQHVDSVHGPAFYQRFELYPCEECHLHRKHLRDYYGVR